MGNSATIINEKGVIFAIANPRVVVSRIFGFLILIPLLFTGYFLGQGCAVKIILESSGIFAFG